MSEYKTIPEATPLKAEWRDDCQGKKDYDGYILSISTRYWGSRDYTAIGGKITKPHASSSVMLYYKAKENAEKYDPGYVDLVQQKFEGETEGEVKELVESWAQEQMDKIVAHIKLLYNAQGK